MDWKVSVSAAALLLASLGAHASASQVDAYKVDATFLKGKHPMHVAGPGNPNSTKPGALHNAAIQTALHNAKKGSGLPGIDSVVNFTGQFTGSPSLDANGVPLPDTTFSYAMVGNAPGRGTTHINAPIIPVTIELLDANGNVAVDSTSGAQLISNPHDKVRLAEDSPVFDNALFTSSRTETQYTDAIHRAQFWNDINQSWHTLLDPDVERGLTMKIPLGAYLYSLNADGTCCQFILVDANTFSALLFPPTFPVDNTTIIGAAEGSGAMTTRDITTFLFPDTYLYVGDPSNCCILGFHSFDQEPGTKRNGNLPRFYMMMYASWISPGLFGPGFEDVTALSHEMAETFTDPFVGFDNVHNITPWWLSGSQCQNLMENGDVIESLPSGVTFPIAMDNGFLYHPQNVPMLQWFQMQVPSTALNGTYSYPDTETLTAPSPPQKVNCAP
ncbi:MAG TPA: hypothetical protein VIE42_03760 [Steroidobacteraceae bacterium]|jgi:hypothetical protein